MLSESEILRWFLLHNLCIQCSSFTIFMKVLHFMHMFMYMLIVHSQTALHVEASIVIMVKSKSGWRGDSDLMVF